MMMHKHLLILGDSSAFDQELIKRVKEHSTVAISDSKSFEHINSKNQNQYHPCRTIGTPSFESCS